MTDTDAKQFFALIGDVHAFYRQPFSDFSGTVWFEAMKPYDFAAVSGALSRHCVNPDSGQFMPKPADVVRMLRGSTQDSALVAWAKVDKAVRTVGVYESVVFDDPLIHRVIDEMGGWCRLGKETDKEWPFVGKEFENRYRGYTLRSEKPEYPPKLVGLAESMNTQTGFVAKPPRLIGNPVLAQRVFSGGVQISHSVVYRLGDSTARASEQLGRVLEAA